MSSAPSFAELGLRPEILRAVTESGYTTPTPIQQQAIPVVLAGKDVMGGAQTGTGKTAGFGLPILHKLSQYANTSPSPARHPVRALILTPTRELAIQVEESIREYGKYTGLRSTVVYGGVDIKQQLAIVRAGVEILVATPGRLLDHIEQKSVYLGQVEIFVLDEADRMLDMGFIPDIKRIMALLPATAKRQNLLFSATFSGEIKKLADELLNQPQLIEVARRNTAAETVDQSAYKVPQEDKRALLVHLVKTRNYWQVLCFVRTKHGASRLARQLEKDGLITSAIHGDKTQAARLEALTAFKDGKLQVLVATDVAARGLDIDHLPVVLNYELPHVPEDYIHRIGRTGRAGASGVAISLVDPAEEKYLSEIEKLLKKKVLVHQPEDYSIEKATMAPAERARATGTHGPYQPHHPHRAPGQRRARPACGTGGTRPARRRRDATRPADPRGADARARGSLRAQPGPADGRVEPRCDDVGARGTRRPTPKYPSTGPDAAAAASGDGRRSRRGGGRASAGKPAAGAGRFPPRCPRATSRAARPTRWLRPPDAAIGRSALLAGSRAGFEGEAAIDLVRAAAALGIHIEPTAVAGSGYATAAARCARRQRLPPAHRGASADLRPQRLRRQRAPRHRQRGPTHARRPHVVAADGDRRPRAGSGPGPALVQRVGRVPGHQRRQGAFRTRPRAAVTARNRARPRRPHRRERG